MSSSSGQQQHFEETQFVVIMGNTPNTSEMVGWLPVTLNFVNGNDQVTNHHHESIMEVFSNRLTVIQFTQQRCSNDKEFNSRMSKFVKKIAPRQKKLQEHSHHQVYYYTTSPLMDYWGGQVCCAYNSQKHPQISPFFLPVIRNNTIVLQVQLSRFCNRILSVSASCSSFLELFNQPQSYSIHKD